MRHPGSDCITLYRIRQLLLAHRCGPVLHFVLIEGVEVVVAERVPVHKVTDRATLPDPALPVGTLLRRAVNPIICLAHRLVVDDESSRKRRMRLPARGQPSQAVLDRVADVVPYAADELYRKRIWHYVPDLNWAINLLNLGS